MRKCLFLIILNFFNLNAYCQVGKWIYVDTFNFHYPARTLISCQYGLNCVVASTYYDSINKNKFCLNLYHSQTNPTDWKLSGIDCSRLIYDSIVKEYYQYDPPVIQKIKLLSNYNQLFTTYDNRLFLSISKTGEYKQINFDTILKKPIETVINLLVSPYKTCYVYFDKVCIDSLPTSKRIYVSNDNGESWSEVQFKNKKLKLKGIFFLFAPTDKDLFMLTYYDSIDKNILYHSPDNGQSWEEIYYPFDTIQNLRVISLFFQSDKNCWISCEVTENNSKKGIIYRTIDGGKSWFKQYEFDNPFIQNLAFIDELNGYILNDIKGYFTSDGGENWITLYDYYNEQLNTKPIGLSKFEILNNNSFLAYNNISVYLYEINPTDINDIISKRNNIIFYYNKLREKVYINLRINKRNFINFKLFNLYGNLLEEKTFSECVEGATYELDVSSYPQGIYFISCTVGGVTEVKKICIIR